MKNMREIAWECGFELPTNAETQPIALYNWFGKPKTKYIVRTSDSSFVFGDKRTGERYKVVNGEIVEQEVGIIR
ncbi:hypothetical protein [Francisella tularensis]|uniref:hypothetical protein n=1 Tax=Francisella tularensis TaxID=263 RepID=UPI000158B451|nr:hypothetical protein [Francisella tularensis]EDN38528.1 conserved hypothetical protein [Francisella tularensis subsp. novicida GA99-3548]MBK2334691.1 hypothetical protein [Francisella tularensis subsp. novicida]MBK2344454.1 hypothetical protein [Francisella tularensis subsp. novicida]MBK2349870.1 hypothetical protein [Francisella tularensis subsp. novicida]MBK2353387.1 hypothetical protein [Francisella tularensis subsp. novicida]